VPIELCWLIDHRHPPPWLNMSNGLEAGTLTADQIGDIGEILMLGEGLPKKPSFNGADNLAMLLWPNSFLLVAFDTGWQSERDWRVVGIATLTIVRRLTGTRAYYANVHCPAGDDHFAVIKAISDELRDAACCLGLKPPTKLHCDR
jgi:hypothetical protein